TCSSKRGRPELTECEHVDPNAWVQELELQRALRDGALLASELIQPWFANNAIAMLVAVYAVGLSRRPAIEEHPKSRRTASPRRSHDKVQVAGTKPVGDPAAGAVE